MFFYSQVVPKVQTQNTSLVTVAQLILKKFVWRRIKEWHTPQGDREGITPGSLSLHVRLPSPTLFKQAGEGEGNLTCRERLLGEHPPTLSMHMKENQCQSTYISKSKELQFK
jgi:hypothetical protein